MDNKLEDIIVENIRQIPEKPMALLLSGGIDSSLVLALLRKTYPDMPISTFALAKTQSYPDIIFARKVAGIFGTAYNEIILTDQQLNEFQIRFDQTKRYGFKGDINVFILCSIAKDYSNIIITGDGGDECFGGYWLHEHPLGHKENGKIKKFEEIHPSPRKHLEEMYRTGFRDFLFKEKAEEKDYEAVWEYFVRSLAPKHLAPLLHTAKVLNIEVFTPLWSESILNYLREIPYTEKTGRKVEKELARKYLPDSVIERVSIGFDLALDN